MVSGGDNLNGSLIFLTTFLQCDLCLKATSDKSPSHQFVSWSV